jgi:hypothetical protein
MIAFVALFAGDPAADLAAAWTLLPDDTADHFYAADQPTQWEGPAFPSRTRSLARGRGVLDHGTPAIAGRYSYLALWTAAGGRGAVAAWSVRSSRSDL